MKVEFPDDLDGRMIHCAQRAKLIATTLQAWSVSQLDAPNLDALYALGSVAEELAEEIEAIQAAANAVENARYDEERRRAGVGGAR